MADGFMWGTISGGATGAAGEGIGIAGSAAEVEAEAEATEEVSNAKGLVGKDFKDYLANELGGEGSFKVGGREFDGRIGDTWYEAKSGQYWDYLMSSDRNIAKFKSDMGDRLNIARQNGATYELYSNTPIPQSIQDWLTKKEIPFMEWYLNE